MKKSNFIYLLIAVVPIGILLLVTIKSLAKNDPDSPITISTISSTVEEIITNTPPMKEQTPNSKAIKIGETDDPKAMGYTAQDKIAINNNGEIFVAYRSKVEDSDFEIFVSKIKNGQLEFDEAITDSDDKTQRVPSIAVEGNTIHITWYGLTSNDSEGRQIKYTKSADGGETWSNPIIPSLVDGYEDDDYWQEHPQILADGNNLYIVWEGKDSDHEEQQIKFTKSTDAGRTWNNWKNVKTNEDNTQSRPYLIFDSQNNLNLFMYSSRESDEQQIWHSISTDKGENWSDWEKVSEGLGDSRHASAALLGDKIFLAWRSGDDEKSQVYFSILNNGEWSDPQIAVASDTYQFFPVVGVNKNGEIGLTWVENSDDSEFPRDDPQENSKGYFSKFNSAQNKFENKILIGENIYYPHLPVKNNFDENFYIAYEEGENKNFEIKLLTAN